jgi:hypothetical protein
VTAYSGVRQQPYTFYFGGVGGGVWKTDDAGITWVPVSDGQINSTGSIGSIDVAPSNPNHVWVGTGSAAIRSNVIIGRGVYKSLDAGKTWAFMGLKDSGQIGGIKVHPFNTNTVWLAALGSPFGPNDERGIFKTTDGGKTWKKTLFVNNETGGRDIEVDWENPDVLYAAMYKGFRKGLGHHQRRSRERRRHLQVDRRRRHVEAHHQRVAEGPDRQDRHRDRAQQSARALCDGRGARQPGRAVPIE